MKHLISIFLLFGFLTQIIFLNSCSDDNAVDESPEATLVSRTNQALSDFPLKTNDLFVFRDTSHFKSFYANAAALAETSPDDLRSNFIDKNFVSVAHLLENDVFERFEDAYSPFLTDPVMMEICNPYYEFQIGDVLVTYINNTQILISDINDINTKNEIRQLEKGNQISVNQIPDGAYWGEDTDMKSFVSGPCSCELTVEKSGCNRIRVFGSCKNLIWGSGEADIRVFLGFVNIPLPGPTPDFTGRFDGNFEYFFDINNTTLIRVIVVPDCFIANVKIVDFLFNPNENSCDTREKDSGWASVISGAEAMRYRAQYFKNWISTYERADNRSIRWNNVRNRWETKDANRLETTIFANRKSTVSCVTFRTETETKTCNNCNKRNATVNDGINASSGPQMAHCDGDVVGTFKKIHGSITLNATATLDFDCCL